MPRKNKPNQPPSRWYSLAAIGIIHWLLCLIIQYENFFLHLYSPRLDGFLPLVKFLLAVPFNQSEHVIVSVLMAAPIMFIPRRRWMLGLYYFFLLALMLWLVIDQVLFATFFDHFRFSFSEGQMADLKSLRGSIIAELRPVFYFNLVIWAILARLLHRAIFRPDKPMRLFYYERMGGTRNYTAAWRTLAAGYALLNIVIDPRIANHNLDHHATLTLVRSWWHTRQPPQQAAVLEERDLYALKFGQSGIDRPLQERLAAIAGKISNRDQRPNLIFIVLESVGSLQLFRDDKLSATVTPNLYALRDRMIAFTDIYSLFPGTIRSHVPMITGGRTITWGSVFKEYSYPLYAPNLITELKKLDYATALISAGDFKTENMRGFYQNLPYDHVFEPGAADERYVKSNEISSWGIKEDAIRELTVDWLEKSWPRRQPFFVHFMTISTHHPYNVPAGYRGPFTDTDHQSNYYNALHYNDSVIGRLLDDLRTRKLLDDTLICVVGDHGEAFGERHPRNFTHKNFIYEENIKTFFIVLDPRGNVPPLTIDRPGYIGDLMPTMLSLLGAPIPQDIFGQDLFAADYQPRIRYFHKNTEPELWGLRDGNWKFIARKVGERQPELYDLQADPGESRNLASSHPQQCDLYYQLCQQWYIQTNDDYTAHLQEYKVSGGRGLTIEELSTPGPKILAFGVKPPDRDFEELPAIHPHEDLYVWTQWVSYPQDKTLIYRWTSPAGAHYDTEFRVKSDWSTTWVKYGGELPLQSGMWSLAIRDGNEELISGTFQVNDQARLNHPQQSTLPRLQSIAIMPFSAQPTPSDDTSGSNEGKIQSATPNKEEFPRADEGSELDQDEAESPSVTPPLIGFKAYTGWGSMPNRYGLTFEWHHPNGQIFPVFAYLEANQTICVGDMPFAAPSEGRCKVVIRTADGVYLGQKEFSPGAVMTAQSNAKPGDASADKEIQLLTFIHINDLHANYQPRRYQEQMVSPLSLIRGYYDQVKAGNPYTVFCSAGDEMEKGSLVELLSRGQSTLEIFKVLGLDVRAIGNHDFAYGLEMVRKFATEPGDVTLCANQFSIGKDYHEFSVGKIRVGIFSMVGYPWDERDKQYVGQYLPEINCRYDWDVLARELIAAHRHKVDILVFLSHLGIELDRRIGDQVAGLDVIIGGHSHTLIAKPIVTKSGAIIVHAGAFGQYLGHLDLRFDLTARKILDYNYAAIKVDPQTMSPNLALEQKIAAILRQYGPEVDQPFCSVIQPHDKPMMATLLGQAAITCLNADAAIIDVGTVWETLSPGPVNRQNLLDCFKVELQPSGTHGFNSIYSVRIDGQQLLDFQQQIPQRFIYHGLTNNIDPRKIYLLALQRRTIRLIADHQFPLKLHVEPVFEGEAWEIIARLGSIKTSRGQALDE